MTFFIITGTILVVMVGIIGFHGWELRLVGVEGDSVVIRRRGAFLLRNDQKIRSREIRWLLFEAMKGRPMQWVIQCDKVRLVCWIDEGADWTRCHEFCIVNDLALFYRENYDDQLDQHLQSTSRPASVEDVAAMRK